MHKKFCLPSLAKGFLIMSDPRYMDYMGPMDVFLAPDKKVLRAEPISMSSQAAQSSAMKDSIPQKVQLPEHLFLPPGAESLDIRRLGSIVAGTTNARFMSFTAPKGAMVHFLGYSIFSDGTLAASQLFVPRVDGKRVFAYHGDPDDQFKINLGLGPDLFNATLQRGQLTLNPTEEIVWFLSNTAAVDVAMGVRMLGYLDYTQTRVNARAGG